MEKKIRNSIGIYAFIPLYHLDRQTPDIMIESIVEGVCIHTRTQAHEKIKELSETIYVVEVFNMFLFCMDDHEWLVIYLCRPGSNIKDRLDDKGRSELPDVLVVTLHTREVGDHTFGCIL